MYVSKPRDKSAPLFLRILATGYERVVLTQSLAWSVLHVHAFGTHFKHIQLDLDECLKSILILRKHRGIIQ